MQAESLRSQVHIIGHIKTSKEKFHENNHTLWDATHFHITNPTKWQNCTNILGMTQEQVPTVDFSTRKVVIFKSKASVIDQIGIYDDVLISKDKMIDAAGVEERMYEIHGYLYSPSLPIGWDASNSVRSLLFLSVPKNWNVKLVTRFSRWILNGEDGQRQIYEVGKAFAKSLDKRKTVAELIEGLKILAPKALASQESCSEVLKELDESCIKASIQYESRIRDWIKAHSGSYLMPADEYNQRMEDYLSNLFKVTH